MRERSGMSMRFIGGERESGSEGERKREKERGEKGHAGVATKNNDCRHNEEEDDSLVLIFLPIFLHFLFLYFFLQSLISHQHQNPLTRFLKQEFSSKIKF